MQTFGSHYSETYESCNQLKFTATLQTLIHNHCARKLGVLPTLSPPKWLWQQHRPKRQVAHANILSQLIIRERCVLGSECFLLILS